MQNLNTNENSYDSLSSFNQDEKNFIVSMFLSNDLQSNEPDHLLDLGTLPDDKHLSPDLIHEESNTSLFNDEDSSLMSLISQDLNSVSESCDSIQELAELDYNIQDMTSSSKEKSKKKRENCAIDEAHNEATEAPEKKKQKKRGRGRPKGSKRKEGFPKKNLSAYNLFFRDERKRILSSIEVSDEQKNVNFRKINGRSDPHRKISFSELGKLIGQNWKNASEKTRRKYDDMAAVEKVAYEKKLEEYKRKKETKCVCVCNGCGECQEL